MKKLILFLTAAVLAAAAMLSAAESTVDEQLAVEMTPSKVRGT